MGIKSSRLWSGLKSKVQRPEVPKQLELKYKGDFMCLRWKRLGGLTHDIELLHLKELMKTVPDVREERITRVRCDLRRGAYNVFPDRIATKIIRGELLDISF
jgi:hypothetical protein